MTEEVRHVGPSVHIASVWKGQRCFIDATKPVWWLSFADPTKPRGEQFLGVVLVHATSVDEAVVMASIGKVNPGGEVMAFQLPRRVWPHVASTDMYRLLNVTEASALDARLACDVGKAIVEGRS